MPQLPGNIRDAHTLLNEVAAQATGQKNIAVMDTSGFVSVGEAVLRTGYENTLNAISTVLSRTIFSTRPYRSKFRSFKVGGERYGAAVRKVVSLYTESEQAQDVNLNGEDGTISVENLADGNSIDMYKIQKPKVMQLNFYGSQALQKKITRFVHQLDSAFKNESEFMAFIQDYMTEFNNEVELLDESKARALLLNRIAGQSAMGLAVVDLTAGYNSENGTQYTRQQLLSEHLESFMRYMTARINIESDAMTDMLAGTYHASINGKAPLLRHTPKGLQRMIMNSKLFTRARSMVFSNIFHPEYLSIGDFETVNYWQDPASPYSIKVTPAILDTATGAQKKAENAVSLDYVVGMLFDVEALGWYTQFDMAATTPLNAAGLYYNTFQHWLFRAYTDYTENAVVFVMGEGGAPKSARTVASK